MNAQQRVKAYSPILAMIGGSASFGLYVARVAPAALYPVAPIVLDGPVEIGIGIAAAMIMLGMCLALDRLRERKPDSPAPRYAGAALPLFVSCAVLLRPFPDLAWSCLVLAATFSGLLLSLTHTAHSRLSPQAALPGRRHNLWQRLSEQIGPLIAGTVAFAAYLATMAPSVIAGDSAEFQTVGYTLGIAHPTGYPLYTLLAKASSFLPFGNVAYRVNLLSGIFGAGTVYLFVHVAKRFAGDARAAVVAGILFAFGAVFWSQAVVAEVYTLNAFLILLVLYLITRGLDQSSHPDRRSLRPYMVWLAVGLGLAHHRTVVLLAPSLLLYIAIARWRALGNPRALAAAAALFLAPLTLYLYLPLRWPALRGEAMDWAQFRWHVLGSGFEFALRPEALWTEPDRYTFLFDLLRDQFTLPGLILGVLGMFALLARRQRHASVTVLAFVTFALFPIAYHVPDVAVFSIPAFLVFALWMASGLAIIMRWTDGVISAGLGLRGGAELCVAAASLIPGFVLVVNYPANDLSANFDVDRWGRLAVQQPIAPGALVIADMLRMSALQYFYGVEHPDRNAQPLMPDTEAVATQLVDESVRSGRPVYLARYLAGLERKYRLSAPGPLVEVKHGTRPDPPPQIAREVSFPGAVKLIGFTPGSSEVPAGRALNVTLFWEAEQKLTDSLFVHLRLIDASGNLVHAAKPGVPVQGLYPTWAWPVGESVADFRELMVPPTVKPGQYELMVGVGGAFRAPEQWARLATVGIVPPATGRTLQATLAVFEDRLALLGYDWGGTIRPGGRASLTLRWQSLRSQSPDHFSYVADLVNDNGIPISSLRSANVPTAKRWDLGDTWIDSNEMVIAPTTPPGTYRLRVRLDSGSGSLGAVRTGWPGEQGAAVFLPGFTVTAKPNAALTNLENKVILARHSLGSGELSPGEQLRLTLFWQPATKLDLDYTAFVHLLDASQRVRAQIDSFPVSGTRPTSGWLPQELVADAYQILLPADLPAGEYQVEVGMYLASTMERLQVLDEDDRPVADRVIIDTVRVRDQ